MHVRLAAAALLVAVAAAAAAAVVDQSQPVTDRSALPFVVGGPTNQVLSQTVTAGVSARLSAVRLPVGCLSGTLTLQVQEVSAGLPSGAAVASQSLPAASLPPPPPEVGFRTIAIPGTPFFEAGERFALVLRSTGTCEVAAGPLGDAYPGGEAVFQDRALGPSGWLPLGPRADLPFQTLVEADTDRPFPPFPEDRTTGFVSVRCFLAALGP
ncbi:MAG: hypothetical protein AB1578_06675 [Thermodesulfobacteriota bacterium]